MKLAISITIPSHQGKTMATIRQAESGKWQAIIRRKGHADKSRTFVREDDAKKWARDIENKIDRDVFVDRAEAEATTLAAALIRYEKEVSVKKDGYEVEKVRIASWMRDDLAKRSLASLKPSDFASWLAARLEHVAPSTARKDLAVISHLFTVSVKRWGMPVINPITKIEIPSEDNARNRVFEGDEETRLMLSLANSGCGEKRANLWILPLCKLAIETAARQSELLAVKWADVDLARSVMRIKGKDRADGKSRTKNKAKFRDLPLSTKAKEILISLPRSIDCKVFPTTASAVKQSFSRAVTRAKIIDFHFHDLRHEGTSRLAEKLAMHELMKVTGHEDTRMLARYYHPRAEDLAKKLG